MSNLETIRSAILARIGAVPDVGVVHPYQRYANRQPDFAALYQHQGQVRGWFVSRVATAERAATSGYNRVVHRWRITGYLSLADAEASELVCDGLIEAMRAAFRHDETLGGAVETTVVDGQAGLQLEQAGPVMFAGVLCHEARLSLATQTIEEIGEEAVDDFATGGVKWDLAPPDGEIEAEDIIHPEIDE